VENLETKTNKQTFLDRKSTFEHLMDLKNLVLHSFLIVCFCFCFCYYFSSNIIFYIQKEFLPNNQQIYYFSVFEPFFLKIKVGFICGLMVSIPLFFTRIAIYLSPTVSNRLYLILYLLVGCIFFYFGIFLSIVFFIPEVVKIMLKTGESFIPFVLNANSFFGMIILLTFVCGIIFEVPLIMFMLLKFEVLTIEKLKKFRKFYLVLSFILGAALTPPDVFSQIVVAVLLILLFEMTLFCFSLCKGTKQ
jgi:sec-independent protein translocase protein TatC